MERHAEFFAPEAVVHSSQSHYTVPEGLHDGHLKSPTHAFPDLHHTVKCMLFDGDYVTMRYHGAGTLQEPFRGLEPSGQPLSYHGNVIFRFAEGKIVEMWSCTSLADWVSQQSNPG